MRVRSVPTLVLAAACAAVLILVGALAGRTGGSAQAQAQLEPAPADAVVVEGRGEAMAEPDTVVATVGVEVRRDSADAALQAAEERTQALRDAAAGAGVAEQDQRTVAMDLRPEYVYHDDRAPEITGYVASHRLELRLRDLATAGEALAGVLAAGGDDARLDHVRFELDDDAAAQADARAAAFDDAMVKARHYAELAGKDVGELRALVDASTTPAPPVPWPAAERAAMEDPAAVADEIASLSVSPGQTTVAVSVTVTVELR